MNPEAPTSPTPPPPVSRKTATALIFGIIFLDMMGVGLIAPLTPYVVERFGGAATDVGILTSSYSGAQFLATPVLGMLSDRYGRRPVLILSLLGTAIGYFIFATTSMYWVLVASRILDGATGGNISTAQAYLADVTPPEDRAKTFGLMGAAFGLGFTLGPTAGALISGINPMAPVYLAGCMALLAMVLVYRLLPETLPPHMRTSGPVTFAALNPASGLIKAFSIPRVPMFLGTVFAIAFAHAELRSSLGIYAKTQFNFSQHQAEWMFAYMGVIAIIVQGFLIRVVSKFIKDRALVLIALPIAAAGFGLLGVPDVWWGMLGCLGLAALGMGLAGPTINGLLSRAAGPKAQGVSMGASQSIASLALVVGPMVAGPLFDHVGKAWPFYTAGLAIALGWLIVLSWKPAPAPDPAHT